VYAAMTRPVLPSRIGVQTRQTVYTRTHDCHSVRFVFCLAERRAPNVCCMCAAPVHANTAKQCKGANVRETPDSKILQTQSIHHTDKAKCPPLCASSTIPVTTTDLGGGKPSLGTVDDIEVLLCLSPQGQLLGTHSDSFHLSVSPISKWCAPHSAGKAPPANRPCKERSESSTAYPPRIRL